MKKKKKKFLLKALLIGVILLGVAIGGSMYLPSLHRPNKLAQIQPDKLFGWKFPITRFPITGVNKKLIAYSNLRDPGGVAQGLPVRLKVPSIGVDSAIEDALVTPEGRMDVPAGTRDVAWFSIGPHPGDTGSAVIGGHFGIDNGVPFVFYNLDKLGPGNKVYIVNDRGDTLAFVVTSVQLFDRNASAATVFTSSDGKAHLNLITCEGVWNQVNGNYPSRRVVFTDSIPSEGAVMIKPTLPQTAIAPSITPSLAPTLEPTSLPSASPSPSAIASALPTPALISKNASASPQILIESAQSLYATPLDGLISSLLLLSIFFLTFRIIRR